MLKKGSNSFMGKSVSNYLSYHIPKMSRIRIKYKCYNASDVAHLSFLYLEEIGAITVTNEGNFKVKLDQDFALLLIKSEYSEVHSEQLSQDTFVDKACIFLKPSRNYYVSVKGEKCELYWYVFSGVWLENIVSCYIDDENEYSLDKGSYAKYRLLWSDIYMIAQRSDKWNDLLINEKLCYFLTLLCLDRKTNLCFTENPDKKIALEIKNYIDEHYNEDINLDKLSQQFYVSKYHMSRMFKKYFSISIKQYHTYIKIEKAKELMQIGDFTNMEIASRIGMYNENYFSRVFKELEGMSPREYKKAKK